MALDVVCFHGFTQNPDVLRKKLQPLLSKTKGMLNLHFFPGPVLLQQHPEQRAYWYYDQENPSNAVWKDHATAKETYHLEESVLEFKTFSKLLPKIDGFLGFSQGGCFVDYLCKTNLIPTVKFAVFISSAPFERGIPNAHTNIKTFHIYSPNDSVISDVDSKRLKESYLNSEEYIHDKNHVVPSNAEAKNLFREFIKINFRWIEIMKNLK